MSKIYQIPNAVNLADLSKLVKKKPKYTKMFAGLAQIDNHVKKFIEDIICNQTDGSVYYIKTELSGHCYNLYLYNAEMKTTVGASWILVEFLEKCEKKTLELELNMKVSTMLQKFNTKLDSDKIYWIN